ncbi:MAG TPA: hypothetical protein VER17_21085 [Tepidisphaeraceae bacterium]|nr:hypothetical protein [Tepidisphaeraceae bacterium]
MAMISTRTHGVLDYVVGAAITALPHVMKCERPTATLLKMAGIGAGLYSMMTDYERGLVKVLPMEAHLALDALSGATLIGAAVMLEDEAPDVRLTLAGIGAFEIAVAAMTSPRPHVPGAPSPAGRIAEYAGVS